MKNFIVISPESKLSKKDFIDIIMTWNTLYVDLTGCGMKNTKMINGLMRVASSIYVIDELMNTPAEFRIQKVVKLAKSGNKKYLEQIYEILREIEHIIDN